MLHNIINIDPKINFILRGKRNHKLIIRLDEQFYFKRNVQIDQETQLNRTTTTPQQFSNHPWNHAIILQFKEEEEKCLSLSLS